MTPAQALEQGYALHRAGKLDEAEPFYAAALRAEPDAPQALHLMGVLRFHQGNFSSAKLTMEKLLARRPDAWETQFFYGQTLAAEGNAQGALTAFGRVASGSPPNNPILLQVLAVRGDMLRQMNRLPEA